MSGPWSPIQRTRRPSVRLCPPLPLSLHLPLAAWLVSASWQACQSLAEGPHRLWLPDWLEVTCYLPFQEPGCHKGMTWPLHPVRGMVPRKANIIFGCIKRSIMYKIKERKVSLFYFPGAHRNVVFGSGQGQKSPLRGRGGSLSQETAEASCGGGSSQDGASGWKWIWTSTCEGLHKQKRGSEVMGDTLLQWE